MKVSVIVTVKNEGDGLRPLLDSLIDQSYFADEIVICDGGSSDNTLEILEEYKQYLPLKIVVAPGSNISQGRNRAVEASSGDGSPQDQKGSARPPLPLHRLPPDCRCRVDGGRGVGK